MSETNDNMKRAAVGGAAAAVVAAGLLALSNMTDAEAQTRLLVSFHDGTHGPAGYPSGTKQTTSTGIEQGWDANMTRAEFLQLKLNREADWVAFEEARQTPERTRNSNDVRERAGSVLLRAALQAEDKRSHIENLNAGELTQLLKDYLIRELSRESTQVNPY